MKGIRQQPNGSWRVYGSVKGQKFHHRMPVGTPLREVQVWRRAKVAELENPGAVVLPDPSEPGFRADAAEYLKTIAGMVSEADRVRHIEEWGAIFRNQPRHTITPFQIRRALEAKRKQRKAASTVNHFRTALLHFFTTMNGRSGANPVKDVPPYAEHSDEVLRAHDYGTIYRLLALMPPSKTRTRLRLLAWTGWPHAQIMRLRDSDIDFVRMRVYVSRRKKGKGIRGRWLPIVLPQTKAALEAFVKEKCFGAFSQPSMRKSLLLAVEKLRNHRDALQPNNAPPVTAIKITPYHLRHSFGTLLALYIEDERALQELLLCSLKQVRRYTAAATDPRVRTALEKVVDPLKSGEAGRKLRDAVAGNIAAARGNFGNFSGNTGLSGVASDKGEATTKSHGKAKKLALVEWRGRRGSNPRPPA